MTCRIAPGSAGISNNAIEREFSGEDSGRVLNDVAGCLTNNLSPVLKVMRIFGIYCGETKFNRMPSYQGPRLYGELYCSVTVLLLWVLFSVTTVSFFFHDISKLMNIVHLLQYCVWLLICAASGTICFYVLPVGRKKTSRFEKFLRHIVSNHGNVNFSSQSTRKLVVIASLVVVLNAGCMIFMSVLDDAPTVFEPWRDLPAFVEVYSFLVMFSCGGVWVYPIILTSAICSILVEAFDDLETRVTVAVKERSLDIDQLRIEHRKLCQTVELADKTLAPLLLAKVGGYVPLLAILCYKLAKFPTLTSDTSTLFIATILWCIAGITIISMLLIHASRVNDKIHGFGKILQQSYFSTGDTKESCELLIFLLHLQDEPLGLTVGGFVVLGALVSYITVLLSLPQ